MENIDLKSYSMDELIEKIKTEKEILQKMKFAHAISSVENPMRIRATRRYIAQLKTELRARELANTK